MGASVTTVDRFSGLRTGLPLKAPCRVATTANITLAGEQTIDGLAVVETNAAGLPDRVLVKNQTTASDNGIYNVSTGNWSRAKDFNGSHDVVRGTRIYVHSGTGAGEYEVTTSDPITVGTTSLAFSAPASTAASVVAAAASAAAAAASETSAAASELAAAASETAVGASEAAASGYAATASSAASTATAQAVIATAQAETALTYAESSGDIQFFDTKAAATAAVAGLSEGQAVEVYADESQSGARTRYRVTSGALVFKLIIDVTNFARLSVRADIDDVTTTATNARFPLVGSTKIADELVSLPVLREMVNGRVYRCVVKYYQSGGGPGGAYWGLIDDSSHKPTPGLTVTNAGAADNGFTLSWANASPTRVIATANASLDESLVQCGVDIGLSVGLTSLVARVAMQGFSVQYSGVTAGGSTIYPASITTTFDTGTQQLQIDHAQPTGANNGEWAMPYSAIVVPCSTASFRTAVPIPAGVTKHKGDFILYNSSGTELAVAPTGQWWYHRLSPWQPANEDLLGLGAQANVWITVVLLEQSYAAVANP